MKLVSAAPVSLAILLSFVVVVCSLIGSSVRSGESAAAAAAASSSQRPTELSMQMGGAHSSSEKAQGATEPAVLRDVRSHAPGHGGPAFAHAPHATVDPAAAAVSRPGGLNSGGLVFTTKPWDYFVGLKGIDTDAGDVLPADDQEGKAWIDLRRQQRDRKPLQTRIIRPGEAVTMDWIASRLNVHLNEQSVISSVTMGGGMYETMQYYKNHFRTNMLLFEYPGYGACEGTPSEDSINAAAEAVLAFVQLQLRWPLDRIVLFGQSIGTGPMCYLAAKLNSQDLHLGGLILQSPYTSLKDAVKSLAGTIASHLIATGWSNITEVTRIVDPILLIHGRRDEIIPNEHSELLFNACASQKKHLLCCNQSTHNDWDHHLDVIAPISQFLTCYLRTPAKHGHAPAARVAQKAAQDITAEADADNAAKLAAAASSVAAEGAAAPTEDAALSSSSSSAAPTSVASAAAPSLSLSLSSSAARVCAEQRSCGGDHAICGCAAAARNCVRAVFFHALQLSCESGA